MLNRTNKPLLKLICILVSCSYLLSCDSGQQATPQVQKTQASASFAQKNATENCNTPFDIDQVSPADMAAYSPVACASTTALLFSEAGPNDVFEFEIQADFDVINDPNISLANIDDAASAGTVRYVDTDTSQTVEIAVTIEARGKSRFSHCAFRPLKIVFPNHQFGNIFQGASKKVKVVTHCGNHPTDPWILGGTPEQQTRRLLAEYYFYQVLETQGSTALATRLARITYRKANGDIITTEYAFLREKEDDTCVRCGFVDETDDSNFVTPDANSVFQGTFYNKFVYNNDYVITGGHNTRICYDTSKNGFYIPYDWDLTGVIRPEYFKNDDIGYEENAITFRNWLESQPNQTQTKIHAWNIVQRHDQMSQIIHNSLLDQEGQDLMEGWYDLYICTLKCYLGIKCDTKGSIWPYFPILIDDD